MVNMTAQASSEAGEPEMQPEQRREGERDRGITATVAPPQIHKPSATDSIGAGETSTSRSRPTWRSQTSAIADAAPRTGRSA